MASYQAKRRDPLLDQKTQAVIERRGKELIGLALIALAVLTAMMLASYAPDDPSWLAATDAEAQNLLGRFGASIASPLTVIMGYGAWGFVLAFAVWGVRLTLHRGADRALNRVIFAPIALALGSIYASTHVPGAGWEHSFGLGGLFGDTILGALLGILPFGAGLGLKLLSLLSFAGLLAMGTFVLGFDRRELGLIARALVVGSVLLYARVLAVAGLAANRAVAAARGARSRMAERRASLDTEGGEEVFDAPAPLRSARADLEQEIEERRLTEEALAESNHEMGVWLHEVEKTSEAVREMAAMSQTLQADLSVEEGLSVIAAYAERLFPELTGAVYLREDLGDEESPLVRRDGWGSADMMAETYARHECWSLRSGRPLQIWGGARALGVCAHAPEGTDCYACIPLVAHGEVFGTLVMEGCLDSAALPARGIAADSAETMQISFAEHVALALANLRFRERLKQESLTDHLTGLHNRRALEDALGREAARARRDGSALAIAMIDVDRFKEYNDVHGHEAGDRVLAAVGGFLKSRTRAGDLACRYGGEEFVLAWPGMTLENAYARAEQLRQAIADLRVTHEGTELRPVTVSVGIATFPDHGVTGEALLAAADVALYEAKAEGRDRVVVAELVACAVEREVTLSGQ